MSNFQVLLGKMRGRLGMYTGSTSITKLAAFLRGYDLALCERGERDDLLEQFRNWIQHRFKTTTVSWEGLILRDSANDEEAAVSRFYNLLDEYLRVVDGEPRTSRALTLESQTTHNPS